MAEPVLTPEQRKAQEDFAKKYNIKPAAPVTPPAQAAPPPAPIESQNFLSRALRAREQKAGL